MKQEIVTIEWIEWVYWNSNLDFTVDLNVISFGVQQKHNETLIAL